MVGVCAVESGGQFGELWNVVCLCLVVILIIFICCGLWSDCCDVLYVLCDYLDVPLCVLYHWIMGPLLKL